LLDPSNLSPFVYRRGQDPNQRSPYIQKFSLGIQRELTPDLLLDIAYVGNKGAKSPGLRNIDAPTVIVNPDGTHSAGSRPFFGLGDVQWMENRVLSNYHSMQVKLVKPFSSGLSVLASYTWGTRPTEAADHLSSPGGPGIDIGVFSVPQNPRDLKAERGLAEFDIRHRLGSATSTSFPGDATCAGASRGARWWTCSSGTGRSRASMCFREDCRSRLS
jgi:hypothetical protein